jgi:hypothetical protein
VADPSDRMGRHDFFGVFDRRLLVGVHVFYGDLR